MPPVNPRLDPSRYLDHIVAESARFRSVLAETDPAARVPACPAWDAADLLWHLTGVQRFWALIVRNRPAGPDTLPTEPERPATYVEMLVAFDAASADLVDALRQADPSAEAWHWSAEHTVGASFRRQAHEALIHRIDAEETAGTTSAVDPDLAADGVHEALTVMYGGCPPWGTITPTDRVVALRLTDRDEDVLVAMARFTGTDPADQTTYDEPDIMLVGSGTPLATISGTAADLDTWLWHRGEGRVAPGFAGDVAAIDELVVVLSQPID
jgi:uncharacterized protein (TIGR03083 family)